MNQFKCPRIDNGLSFNYDGTLDVCAARRKVVQGSLDDNSHVMTMSMPLFAFFESRHRQSLIQDKDNGTWPLGCESCMHREQAGKTSLRQSLIEHAGNKRYLHVSISNICDSDCIMCGPAWSSRIAARLHKHPDNNNIYLGSKDTTLRRWWQDPAMRSNMLDAAKWAEHIHVVGGEPMIDPDVWQFLDHIADSSKELSFVTNLNSMPAPNRLEILSRFKSVSMTASIDAVGKTHEWIRQGVSWRNILRNIINLKQLGININVHCTVQAHGLQDIGKHYELFNTAGLISSYDLLKAPALLAINNAPRWVLEQQLQQLEKAHAGLDLLRDIQHGLDNHQSNRLAALIKHTDYLNGHRQYKFNTDTWQVETQ